MSGPYVYTPSTFQPPPSLGYGQWTQRSPFIPSPSLYPSSPHAPSSPYLRPSTPQDVPMEIPYYAPPTRARRPSWHGGSMPPTPFLTAASTSPHYRRRSFGGGFTPSGFIPSGFDSPWDPWTGASPGFELHPLLNGEVPRTDFFFDLAAPSFTPVHLFSGQSMLLSEDELRTPATNPPITHMCITHDAIPQWPIDIALQYDTYTPTPAPPITLGDVLYMIHASLHRQISHRDWAEVNAAQETAIARAYTQRYRSVPSRAKAEANQGVKRVDYLLERHIFGGLVRAQYQDDVSHWRLITRSASSHSHYQ